MIIIASNEIQEQGNKIKIKLQLLLFLPHRRDSFAAAVAHETGCAAVCTLCCTLIMPAGHLASRGPTTGLTTPHQRALFLPRDDIKMEIAVRKGEE